MDGVWSETADHLRDLASKPEKFLEPSKCQALFEKSKVLTKVFYDAAKLLEEQEPAAIVSKNRKKKKSEGGLIQTLPQLIIEDFDQEQVWAGVDLQNKAKVPDFSDQVHDLLAFDASDFSLFALPTQSDEAEEKQLEDLDDENEGLEDFDPSALFDVDDHEEEEEEEEDQDDADEEEVEEKGDDDDEEKEEEKGDMDDDILNDPDFQHMSDSDLDDLPLFEGSEKDSDEDSDLDEEKKEKAESKAKKEKRVKAEKIAEETEDYMAKALSSIRSNAGLKANPRSQVEDDFFKLDDMEKFLDDQDAADNRRRLREEKGAKVAAKSDDEEDDEFEGIDFFSADLGAPSLSSAAAEDADQEENEDGEATKFNDYFGGQQQADPADDDDDDEAEAEGEDSDEEEQEMETSGAAKSLLDDDDEDDDGEEDMGEAKSSHEERMRRLQKKIAHLEEEALKGNSSEGKMWQMKGEIAGVDRPENSLLQEHLDYDTVSKQAPVITEAVSKTLEEIITQRIKDKAWDDVERKVKPVENPYEYKKRLVLDQEKSKLSLAQVYEQEYLKQQEALEDSKKTPGMLDDDGNETIPPEVDDIKKSMKFLFAKLDTLTHFHYTPRMQDPEVKIVRNAPTLAMEEVAPVAMSDANLLAPQEIVDKARGEEIGQSERLDEDRKRERRKKKTDQRVRAKDKEKREKLVNKLNPGLGNKYSKAKMIKELESAEKQGKVTKIKEDAVKGKSVKSSSAFFNQLQNEAQSVVKQAKSSSKNRDSSKVIASNLKL